MFRADAEPKIYRLYNERLNLTYYGSTILSIGKRFNNHKSHAKQNITITSTQLFQEGDDVTCEVVEYVDCLDKETLHKREKYYIENFDCVNKVIPARTKAEYHQDNKEKRNEKNRIYRQDNKEIIKQYYQDNKEKIKERDSQKIECECGSVVRRYDIERHRKSQKHQKLIIK